MDSNMNPTPYSAICLTDDLKARIAHLSALLKIIDSNGSKKTKIERLSISTIKTMIDALDTQLKKRS
jgi:hypothetical protein